MINNDEIFKVPRVFVVRIVNFGRRRRIVTETAIVAAVQARVTVLVVNSAGSLVDCDWFPWSRWQCLRWWWEKRDRGWYVPSILTRHYWGWNGWRRRPVRVDPVTIRSTVRPGPCLYTKITISLQLSIVIDKIIIL